MIEAENERKRLALIAEKIAEKKEKKRLYDEK